MNPLYNEIITILTNHPNEPLSIHQIAAALPQYNIHDIKLEIWDITANGQARFDSNWKLIKSNDGPATF